MELINKRDKRGSLFFAFISGFMLFMAGLVFMNFIMPEVDGARVSMNCSNSTNISDGNKLTCLGIDGTIPYFILVIFSVAGGFIIDKITA